MTESKPLHWGSKVARWGLAILVALLAGAALVAAGLALRPWLFPEYHATAPLTDCDLQQQACVATFPDGATLRLEITPRPIPVYETLDLQVDLVGLEVQTVEIDFRGVSMNMGYNRPALRQESPHRFTGPGALPGCYKNPMDWEALVRVTTPDQKILAAPFRFEVYLTPQPPAGQ